MDIEKLYDEANEATYCPEDNKLRLYVGRVARDEYLALRNQGWKSTPKQDCDFVATWSPEREDTAIYYAGTVGDEDQSPEDRAADRADRFAGYRDKRAGEAVSHADRFDAGPAVHGHQSQARAERAARKHDRQRAYAVRQWDKAEYWQTRTAAVISHALHKSSASVRRGRILKLEAEQRKQDAAIAKSQAEFDAWQAVQAEPDAEKAYKQAYIIANRCGGWGFHHPRAESESEYVRENGQSLYGLLTLAEDPITGHEAAALALATYSDGGPSQPGSWSDRWRSHYTNRLNYERAMLENEGGSAAAVDIVPGGWFGQHQVYKVNKSRETGRVVSVMIKGEWGHTRVGDRRVYLNHANSDGLAKMNIERLGEDAYRPPTAEEAEAFKAEQAAMKAAKKKANAAKPKLINPTREDAEKLQALFNEREKFPSEVREMTQAEYSARSKGTYARYQTKAITEKARPPHPRGGGVHGRVIFKIRTGPRTTDKLYAADSVVVITDKPQKPIPWVAMEAEKSKHMTREQFAPLLPELVDGFTQFSDRMSDRGKELFAEAAYLGLAYKDSLTQYGLNEQGAALLAAVRDDEKVQA